MDTITDLAALSSSVFGLFSLLLGIRLLRRKPLVMPSTLLWAIPLIIVLPILVTTMPTLVQIKSPMVLWALLPLLAIPAIVLFMVRNFGHVTLFNVTEGMVYASLFAVLRKHGIEYAETRSRIHLTHFGSFIHVTVQDTTNMAFLRFSDPRAIPKYHTLMADFNAALQTTDLVRFPVNGVFYIALALLFLGTGLTQIAR